MKIMDGDSSLENTKQCGNEVRIVLDSGLTFDLRETRWGNLSLRLIGTDAMEINLRSATHVILMKETVRVSQEGGVTSRVKYRGLPGPHNQ